MAVVSFQNVLTSVGGLVIIGFGVYLILSTRLRRLNFEKNLLLFLNLRPVTLLRLYLDAHLRQPGRRVWVLYWAALSHWPLRHQEPLTIHYWLTR